MDLLLLLLIFNFLALASSFGLNHRKGSCPAPADWDKTPIDAKKMSGDWYFIFSPFSARCSLDSLVPTVDGKSNIWLAVGLLNFHGYQQYTIIYSTKPDEVGTVLLYQITSSGSIGFSYKIYFLKIKHEKYMVLYGCEDDAFAGTYGAGLWIASRSPLGICDEDWSDILDAVSKAGIADKVSTISQIIDQTNCPKQSLRSALAAMVAEFTA